MKTTNPLLKVILIRKLGEAITELEGKLKESSALARDDAKLNDSAKEYFSLMEKDYEQAIFDVRDLIKELK